MSFDPVTFLLQGVNFLVLVFVLWRLLWKPLRAHMEDRRTRIEEGIRQVEQEGERIKALTAEAQSKLKDAEEAKHQSIRRAELAAENRRQELLDEAHRAARAERDRVLTQVALEQKKQEQEFLRALSPTVSKLLRRLLGELGDDARLHERSCGRFATYLAELEEDERTRISEAAESGEVELLLAREDMPPELRQALVDLLPELPRTPQTDRSLVAGACLRVGEIVLDGSVRSQVERALERPA